jgi:hypothetical protein
MEIIRIKKLFNYYYYLLEIFCFILVESFFKSGWYDVDCKEIHAAESSSVNLFLAFESVWFNIEKRLSQAYVDGKIVNNEIANFLTELKVSGILFRTSNIMLVW